MVTSLVTILLKVTLFSCTYSIITKKTIILSLFKIDTLNVTSYILMILMNLMIMTCPLKIYVIGLHNLISMNIFFSIKDHS